MLVSAIFKESSPFDNLFSKHRIVRSTHEFVNSGAIALVLWGGEDISPAIYKQRPAPQTDAFDHPSLRDRLEVELATMAINIDIPIIGICRGAQLMCALSGGTVIQHVEGHAGPNHAIYTDSNELLVTNSVHHQMMNPFKVDHKLLGWVPAPLSSVYIGDNGEPITDLTTNPAFVEPEIVWFPQTRALCIQGHPEYFSANVPFIRHCLKLVRKYILNEPEED